ncbi:MAG: aminotransferase class V-fold PLP-dependent enzyme [Planctomycetales bacterium]|nr:aminotransferase class V-fold PLP-dependent enzyme [Planctomycetales bacterium]
MLAQDIASAVRKRILRLIDSGDWRSYDGRQADELCKRLAACVNQPYCQLASSGSAALEIGLRAAGIGPGDEVILSAYDYPGNFWAIERAGARPVLVDITGDSWNIDLSQLAAAVAHANSPKALIASHLHGMVQPIPELRNWCQQHGITLIEDACQALGGKAYDGPVGSSGEMCILSFGGSKTISAGRGGAVLSNDPALAQRIRLAAGAGSGPYAMSEMQCAAVLAQLDYLDALNQLSNLFFRKLDSWLRTAWSDLSSPRWHSTDYSAPAYYQAGWLLPKLNNMQTQLDARETFLMKVSQNSSFHLGIGFPGFHRRSARRCRIATAANDCSNVDKIPLLNTLDIQSRTVVMSFQQALLHADQCEDPIRPAGLMEGSEFADLLRRCWQTSASQHVE